MSLAETYIIAISGPTTSGKTTLARLLRRIFDGLTFTPQATSALVSITATILHQDDFLFPEDKIPLKRVPKDGSPGEYVELADWDCLEAIDFEKLKCCLKKFRNESCTGAEDHARILEELGIEAVEATNSVGPERVTEEELEGIRGEILNGLAKFPRSGSEKIHILILEGFLLYFDETPNSKGLSSLLSLFDTRLMLHTTFENAVYRRKARMAYVTVEGYFADPPGFVENIVWPNYVKYHRHLFEDGDVERGELCDWARKVAGILRQPREGMEVRDVVEWGASVIVGVLLRNRSG